MMDKFVKLILTPIIGFCKKLKRYKEEQNYIMIMISFLVSFILFILIIAVISAVIIGLMRLGTRHIGVVTIIGAIVLLYWAVYDKYIKNAPLQEQYIVSTYDTNLALLHNYAQNGYRDMRLIVFKTLKAVGEILGFTSLHLLTDIECIQKYYISYNNIFYTFNVQKADITKSISDDELNDDINIIQNVFNDLWQKGEFPNIALQTYIDNNGIILPPISFCLLTDMGRNVEITVSYTTPAYVSFMKGVELEQNATQNIGYDMNDSHML